MKNIFTLLLGGLLTTSAFASNITLTFSGNRNFQVLVDGRSVNSYDNSGSTVYLNGLQYGQHSIEVYRMRKSGLFGNRNDAVYSANFTSSPQYDLNMTVDNSGRIQMYQTRSNDYGNNGYGRNNQGSNHGYGNNRGYGNNNGGYGNGDRQWKKRKDRDRDGDEDDDRDSRHGNSGNNGVYDNGGYNDGGYGNGGYNNGGNNNRYNQPMNDYDFNQLVQRIRSQWIGKLSTARDAVNSNYFNTYQVRQLLQLFSSESDRLDLAEQAFKNVTDQQNFRQLYDLFSYQSQTELDRYTRDVRY